MTFNIDDTQPCYYEPQGITIDMRLVATVVICDDEENCGTVDVSISGTVEGCYNDICETQGFSEQTELTDPSDPCEASDPSPANEATNQPTDVDLSWSCCGACTFDVYFGECGSMVKVSDNQDGTTFDPGPLSYATDYCWRIDSNNTNGTTTGDDWYFTTGVNPNQSPVIESVSALPSYILDNQISLLEVVASDSDGPFPLSYDWTVLPSQGTLDDYSSPTPVYIPPDITSSQQTFTITVDVFDGINTSSSSVDVNVIDINSITCDFYQDWYIDFVDFAILASYWVGAECADPNWCEGTDVDHSGSTDILELSIFIEHWLSEGTDLNLVAYWPMDDNDSNTFVSDISGNGHNGIASANTELLSAPGIVNTCFDLGGADVVEVADAAALSFDDTADKPFSIAAWIYVTPHTASQSIFTKWETLAEEYSFHLDSNEKLTLTLIDENTEASVWRVTDSVLSEGWHFVAAVYDNADTNWTAATAVNYITLYIDDAEAASTATNNAGYEGMEAGATNCCIGGYYIGAAVTNSFQDKIDNVILFDIALTGANVSALYNIQ